MLVFVKSQVNKPVIAGLLNLSIIAVLIKGLHVENYLTQCKQKPDRICVQLQCHYGSYLIFCIHAFSIAVVYIPRGLHVNVI